MLTNMSLKEQSQIKMYLFLSIFAFDGNTSHNSPPQGVTLHLGWVLH